MGRMRHRGRGRKKEREREDQGEEMKTNHSRSDSATLQKTHYPSSGIQYPLHRLVIQDVKLSESKS